MEKNILKKDFKNIDKKDKAIVVCLIIIFVLIIATGIVFLIKKNDKDTLDRIEKNKKNVKEEWTTVSVVKFDEEKDVKYYEYCANLTKDEKDCLWSITPEHEITISTNGHRYVFYRLIGNDDKVIKKGMKEIFVDNSKPVINKVDVLDEEYITLRVDAIDNVSSIAKYYYSLDDTNYTEGTMTNVFKDLDKNGNFTIYVKVVDAAGNEAVSSIAVGNVKNTQVEPETTPEIVPEVTPEATQEVPGE